MKRKDFLIFFYLPFLGIVIIFFIFSSLNRAYIKNKVEELVKEQIQATAEILRVNISHFLRENYKVDEIFKLYSREENIYYMALLDERKEILSWSSRFEGYLPLSLQAIQDEESWIIESPAGKIFNFFSPFSPEEGRTFFLYLGYSLRNLEEMIAHSWRNFFFTFGLIFVVGIILFTGFYQLQRHYLEKKKEAKEEKVEKERFREISAFTSSVAHEIKNPLNSLSLLFELLQKKVSQGLQKEVALGKAEIQKISRIIDQFTTSLKPLKLKKEKFFLGDLVEAVRDSLAKESGKAEVEIRYSQASPVMVKGDKDLLSQALFNILRNSVEASESGLISIQAEEQKKEIIMKIRDTGKGIPEQDKERIFEPFFSRKKKGMGIGLYLAKKIIEAHEGKIEFKSELGKGTTFFIQIPGG